MNEEYEIEVGTPLLRPGLRMKTRVSRKYILDTLEFIMATVREFNKKEALKTEASLPSRK